MQRFSSTIIFLIDLICNIKRQIVTLRILLQTANHFELDMLDQS